MKALKASGFILIFNIFSLGLKAQNVVSSSSNYNLAMRLYYGKDTLKDYQKVIQLLNECASSGYSIALITLGDFYETGKAGLTINYSEASSKFNNAATLGNPLGLYHLGIMAKDGHGQAINYTQAYNYFTQAANANCIEGIYGLGYLNFKGFGCTQNYTQAAEYFKECSQKKHPNGTYFYGLCFRNGYGKSQNYDSSKFYLTRAVFLGSRMAISELKSPTPENSNNYAMKMASNLSSNSNTRNTAFGEFSRVSQKSYESNLNGKFVGHLIRYDWSNTYAISESELTLDLSVKNNIIKGSWLENKQDEVKLNATILSSGLKFQKTSYKKADHYSMGKKYKYIFDEMDLKLSETTDSIFIEGQVKMFSVNRNEPEKPVYIYLAKVKARDNVQFENELTTEINNTLSVYPNPFSNIVNIGFSVAQSSIVQIKFLSSNGKEVFISKQALLDKGTYRIPINSSTFITGMYFVQLIIGDKVETSKAIKL